MTLPAFESLLGELQALEHGPGHGAELYERVGVGLELAEDELGPRVLEVRERGLALRLFRGHRVSFAAGEPEGAARLLVRAQALLPRARSRRGARAPGAGPGEAAKETAPEPALPDELAAHELLAGFRRALAQAGGKAITLREASVSVGARRERVATTNGRDVAWTTAAASLTATVVGRSASGRFSARVIATAARPEELPVARLAQQAVDRVLLPLTGRPFAAARSDLLLDPQVAAHVIARLAPLFFGDREDGLLAARTRGGGDAVASRLITLVDDPAAPGGPIRSARDGEGSPKRRTVVVADGVPAALLTDVASAARREQSSSGNAFRRSWSEPPVLGVTNFHVDPSRGVSPLDLLRDVSRGLYAAQLVERPEVDLGADRFRLVVAGYALEKGRAAEKVSEALVSGRLSELLRSVAALGDDLKFVPGAGGGVGSPTLYIPRWRSG